MIQRNIEQKFLKYTTERKAILVTGARQVGKSTFIKELIEKDRTYVTLDDFTLRSLAQSDPRLFLMNYGTKLAIDEAQYAPELFPYIKMQVDASSEKNHYWLTGSQRFELMAGISESLAGRVGILEMSPLSVAEKEGYHAQPLDVTNLSSNRTFTPEQIFHHIFIGGMPEYVSEGLDREMFFSDYIKTYLERDIRQLANVGDLASFHRFVVSVAARNGEVVNYHSIAEDADIDEKTAKKWLSVLEASDLVYLLQPYSNNLLTRTTEAPKIIFLDTGLCAYLCGWNTEEALANSAVSGHFLETFLVAEIIKNKRNLMGPKFELYFYRDKDQKEIDLIIKADDVLYPFEIKKTARPEASMLRNFQVLEGKHFKIGNGGILCFYPDIIPLTDAYKSYPISVMLG